MYRLALLPRLSSLSAKGHTDFLCSRKIELIFCFLRKKKTQSREACRWWSNCQTHEEGRKLRARNSVGVARGGAVTQLHRVLFLWDAPQPSGSLRHHFFRIHLVFSVHLTVTAAAERLLGLSSVGESPKGKRPSTVDLELVRSALLGLARLVFILHVWATVLFLQICLKPLSKEPTHS